MHGLILDRQGIIRWEGVKIVGFEYLAYLVKRQLEPYWYIMRRRCMEDLIFAASLYAGIRVPMQINTCVFNTR